MPARFFLPALALTLQLSHAQSPHDGWSPLPVPSQPTATDKPGFTWFRTYINVPADWNGSRLLLVAGGINTVDEAFFNGEKIGANGAMPPLFSKPASDIRRPFVIEPDQVRFGADNLIAWRAYSKDQPATISTGPIHLSRKDDAIDLAGTWLKKSGDKPTYANWHSTDHAAEANAFRTLAGDQHAGHLGVVPADTEGRNRIVNEVYERFKNNKNPYAKNDDKGAPLSPQNALTKLKTATGLALDSVLAEPIITQPLYIEFDPRGRLWLTEYIQYPDPAGLEVLTWDKHLRKVFDQVPPPPPYDTPEKQKFRGRDIISVHEDTDGDGTYDSHKTFVDGLNMATSTAWGDGGIWVMQPPYLLFYPDADNNDVPDAPPVVHLSGFGLEDTHSIANSLKFGPDGWLYGATGSTVTARVRTTLKPKTPPLQFFGQNIWRYHPKDHRFELFAEGGWNTFGVDFDDKGRLYSGTNGTQQAVYFVQGGFYQKSFGKHGPHTNPYTFGHFFGLPIDGEKTRLVHQWLLYQGGAIPQLENKLVGGNSLASKLHALSITPDGSSFKTVELDNPVTSSDRWFRPVHCADGPDGAIYISDFYDARITHVDPRDNWDRQRGRVYRLRSDSTKPSKPADLRSKSTADLVALLESPNRWTRRTAQRLIATRKDTSVTLGLRGLLAQPDSHQLALEALWALNAIGGLDDATALGALDHTAPHVRLWTVRLLGDHKKQLSGKILSRLTKLSYSEQHPEVIAQLAATAARLPTSQAARVITALLHRNRFSADPYIPLQLWWATESLISRAPDRALAILDNSSLWSRPLVAGHIASRVGRRFMAERSHKSLAAAAVLLRRAPSREAATKLVTGMEQALVGTSLDTVPAPLNNALASLRKRFGDSPEITAFALRLNSIDGLTEARETAAAPTTPLPRRLATVRTLAELHDPAAAPLFVDLATAAGSPAELRHTALNSLRRYLTPGVTQSILTLYPTLTPELQRTAASVLSGQPASALALLQAVDAGRIPRTALASDILLAIQNLADPTIGDLVKKLYGTLRQPAATKTKRITEIKKLLADNPGKGDPTAGAKLFATSCAVCHQFRGSGRDIAPDLTGYEMSNTDFLVTSIVDPNLGVREEFELSTLTLHPTSPDTPATVLSGFVTTATDTSITLKDLAGNTTTTGRSDIADLTRTAVSVMPEGLLDALSPGQLLDLLAFLQSPAPKP